jgi:hypothetical protein
VQKLSANYLDDFRVARTSVKEGPQPEDKEAKPGIGEEQEKTKEEKAEWRL